MKIGLFSDTYPPEINGVANSTYILKNELEKLGHEVYVITTNSEGKVDTHWEEDGKVLRFKGTELKFLYGYVMTSPFHFKALHEIEKFLAKEKLHLNSKTRIFKSSNNFLFLGRNPKCKYSRYRNIKRKLKSRYQLYKNGKIPLGSFISSLRCYQNLSGRNNLFTLKK